MHLSSKELNRAYAIYGGPATERAKWLEESLEGSGAMVSSHEWSSEEKSSRCPSCGRKGGAAELYSEVGGYAQWRADRALWSAAEPVQVAETLDGARFAELVGYLSED